MAKKADKTVQVIGNTCSSCAYLMSAPAKISGARGIGCNLTKGMTASSPICKDYRAIGVELTPLARIAARKKNRVTTATTGNRHPGWCLTSGTLIEDLFLDGGIAPGRFYTKVGRTRSGKTTQLFGEIAEALMAGIPTKVWDAEGAIDWGYARRCGVPVTYNVNTQEWGHPNLEIIEVDSGDEWYEYAYSVLSELPPANVGPYSQLWIVDSIPAMTPRIHVEKPGNKQQAIDAKMHKAGWRLIKTLMRKTRVSVVMVSHIGMKPGTSFGNPAYTKGGEVIDYYSDYQTWVNGRASGMETFGPAVKPSTGGALEEKSWTGKGKDTFVYTQMKIKKSKTGGIHGIECWSRICTRTSGNIARGTGIDPAYDVLQFLVATGQADWVKTRGFNGVLLRLEFPRFNPKTKKIRMLKNKKFWENRMPWYDFKRLVMSRGAGIKDDVGKLIPKGPDLREMCRQQLSTHWAQNRLAEIMAGTNISEISENP